MAGSAVAAAWAVTPRWTSADRLERALVGALLVLAQAVGVPLLLGMVGLLALPTVVVAHILLAVAALAWARRHPVAGDATAGEPGRGWHPADLAGVGAAVGYLVLGAVVSLRRFRSLD